VPLAALAIFADPPLEPDLPIAYAPRVPEGRNYREMLERAVGWGRR
jgi:hypothetical protein